MDLETITLTVKDKHHMISPICGIKKKGIQVNFLAEEKHTQTLKNLLKGTGGWGGWEGWTGGLGWAGAH